MLLLYVATVVFIIFIIDDYMFDKRQLQLVKHFNGFRRLPIIGQAWVLLDVNPKNFIEFGKRFREDLNGKNSRIAYVFLGNMLEIGIEKMSHIEQILTSTKFLTKSSNYNFLSTYLGEGLLFSTNQKWFNRRRIITPTFHFKILEQFFEVFCKQNRMLLDEIEKKSKCEEFLDIFPLIGTSILKSLCETAMGIEMKNENFKYLDSVRKFNFLVATSFLSPWHRIKFIYDLTPTKRELTKCTKIMRDCTSKIIEERRRLIAEVGSENLDDLDDNDVGLKKKMCLLDVLLQSKIDDKPLSNEDIQEEVDTFTFAGHDTTTNATCFTLYMISLHPEVQGKLNEEIKSVLGDGELTFKSLNEFKYLEMVIKETLRIYPPVPIISRQLYEETKLDDFTLPRNANYNLSLYGLFTYSDFFQNTEEFIPERFLSNVPPFAFIPFSAGQRNCIGQKFAMVNMKTNIINILRRFEIKPGDFNIKLEIHITLKCNGIYLKFIPK